MNIHKYKARVTKSKFGRWANNSMFTDQTWMEIFFRVAKIDVNERLFRFGAAKIKPEEMEKITLTDSDDVEITLSTGKTLYVMFNEKSDGFVSDLKQIGAVNIIGKTVK
jgi:hypothetical protein